MNVKQIVDIKIEGRAKMQGAHPSREIYFAVSASGNLVYICNVYGTGPWAEESPESRATAVLIAVAPGMLRTLEQSLMALLGVPHRHVLLKSVIRAIYAAIAKAKVEV